MVDENLNTNIWKLPKKKERFLPEPKTETNGMGLSSENEGELENLRIFSENN